MLLALLLAACSAPERDCSSLLWFVDEGGAQRVEVAGDFNGWNPASHPMVEVEPGAWRLQLHLDPGDYEYLLVVDGEERLDPLQPLLHWDPSTQEETSLLRVEDCSEPALEVESVELTADGQLTLDAVFLRAEGGARLAEVLWMPGEARFSRRSGRIELRAELPPGKSMVRLFAMDSDGRGTDIDVPLWVEDAPFSWEDALIYQVVTDRFAGPAGALGEHDPGEIGSRLGGDLDGLREVVQSGYFESLGVNALWISPVYDNPEGRWAGSDGHLYEGYHGYWPAAPDEVEPGIGGSAALHDLVEAAHARGIRVILDVVPNHVHEDHPWVRSHWPAWFHEDPACVCGDYECPWATDLETCWFTDYLPDLALERPEVVREVMASAAWWAREYEVDGFRVDAVPMMPRSAVRELIWELAPLEVGGTRFYTLGETYTRDGYGSIRSNLGPFGLDGQFEFPVLWALRGLLAWETGDAADLAEVIATSMAAWEGSGSVMAPFAGNHDVARFLSDAAGDDVHSPWDAPPPHPVDREPFARLVAAQAVVLTLPGAPVIYYGDEVGLAGATDPDSRRPMPFVLDANQAWTLDRVRRLGRARACSTALRRGDWEPLIAEGTAYAHLRDAGDGEPALLALNASGAEAALAISIPADLTAERAAYLDVVEGEHTVDLAPGEDLEVVLPPWTARVYLPSHLDCHPGGSP